MKKTLLCIIIAVLSFAVLTAAEFCSVRLCGVLSVRLACFEVPLLLFFAVGAFLLGTRLKKIFSLSRFLTGSAVFVPSLILSVFFSVKYGQIYSTIDCGYAKTDEIRDIYYAWSGVSVICGYAAFIFIMLCGINYLAQNRISENVRAEE